jgi:glycosyltransferase involved in cell wall biosynthesis
MKKIRVGYVYYQVNWIGGVNYLRNLFTAIQSLTENTIQPVLLAGFKADISEFEALAEIVRSSILDRYSPQWWLSKLLAKAPPHRDYLLYRLLRRHQIDLLSHFGRLWQGCSIPTIGWIPDFQHMHLPDFFEAKECAARDAQFKDIIRNSDAVIVSSQAGLDDLMRFEAGSAASTYILRFVSCLYPNMNELPSRNDLCTRYNLDRPWFHLPNQFWAHKNHSVVLRALYAIKQTNQCPLIISTGSTQDYRNPGYFSSLMKMAHDYGVQDDFRALGVLPYSDVMGLMRHAVAIINPSLCEGWSTTVEEAKAMGKQVILSDIAVHREQNPKRGHFFNSDDGRELAQLMCKALDAYDGTKEEVFQYKAQQEHIEMINNFAKQYDAIVLQVLG